MLPNQYYAHDLEKFVEAVVLHRSGQVIDKEACKIGREAAREAVKRIRECGCEKYYLQKDMISYDI